MQPFSPHRTSATGGQFRIMNWDRTIEDLAPGLFRYHLQWFAPDQADELTQETLVRLVDKVRVGGFDERRGTLRTLSYGIARMLRLEHRRHLIRGDSSIEPDEIHDETQQPHLVYEGNEAARRLRAAVAKLPPAERDIVALLLDRDLKLKEIAEITQTPLNTVKSHMHRAKLRLRLQLEQGERHERS